MKVEHNRQRKEHVMNDQAKILKDIEREISAQMDGDGFAGTVPPRLTFQSDMQRFMASAENLLRSTRKRLLEADAVYREKRVTLVNQMTDDLHRLDQEHDARIAELRA